MRRLLNHTVSKRTLLSLAFSAVSFNPASDALAQTVTLTTGSNDPQDVAFALSNLPVGNYSFVSVSGGSNSSPERVDVEQALTAITLSANPGDTNNTAEAASATGPLVVTAAPAALANYLPAILELLFD
jgi:hypothetical protein